MFNRACYNRPQGKIVSPEEFMRFAGPNYQEKGVFAYCPSCDAQVTPVAVNIPDRQSSFRHPRRNPDADPLDDCVESNRQDGRFRGMHTDEWDFTSATRLREQFFKDDNLRLAYTFCLNMCGRGRLPVEAFIELIKRADRKRIWAYKDIPLWTIPYILLTLGNFTANNANNNNIFGYHFIFNKTFSRDLSQIWQVGESCTIEKVFSNSGIRIDSKDNPYVISEQKLCEKAGDYAWINNNLLVRLKEVQ